MTGSGNGLAQTARARVHPFMSTAMKGQMGNTDLKAGTAGGVALTILVHIGTDLLHTALTAIIGAFVSFTVSRLLQKWWGDKPRR